MKQTADLLICGAGIAGIATAYYLAHAHGITDVLIVDPHPPLSQTTAKSGENYRNWWPFPPLVDFTNRSIDLMEALAEETHNLFQMHRRGYLYVSMHNDVDAVTAELEAIHNASNAGELRPHNGYTNDKVYDPLLDDYYQGKPTGADLLIASEIQRWFPHLTDEIRVALHVRRAGALSVQLLSSYLLDQTKACGVRLLRGEVTAIHQDGQGISQVTIATSSSNETIQTRTLVNAAGPFLPHVARLLGLTLPVFSVFQQKIAMPDPQGVLPRNAPFTIFLDDQTIAWSDEERHFWESDKGYAWLLQQFPGGLHIRPEGSGDSTWVKMGWAINQQAEDPVWSPQGSPEFPELLLRGATRFIPGLATYAGKLSQPLVHYGGYYTKTKENLPLIGPMDIPGTYLVGALSGYGTMAGCAAGELCAQWIAGSTLPNYADIFSLSRYENPCYRSLLNELKNTGEL